MKVLVAEDSIVSRRLLEVTLQRWGYEPITVGAGNEAWAVLKSDDAPGLAILDWMMPGLTGLQVCNLVRQQAREKYTYILLLTSKSDKADMVEGMEAGADDYISKPFEQNELKVRLRAGRRIVELQSELLATREALRDQATLDSLTRAWNRHTILDICEKEFVRSQRESRNLSVVMFDLDHFKHVNDRHGHLGGDAVLREVATRVQESLRPYDALGRYGGEEFLIVLPGCDNEAAFSLAERIRELLSAKPVEFDGASIPITGSFGVATLSPLAWEINQLIRLADEGAYEAKRNGRNRVACAPDNLALSRMG